MSADDLTALSVCRLAYAEARTSERKRRIRETLPERAARLFSRANDRLMRARAWRRTFAQLGITNAEVEALEAETRRNDRAEQQRATA